MVKKILLLSLLAGTLLINAQVGINTASPNSSLEIVGKPTDATVKDGLLIPKLTGAQLKLKTYTSNQNSALVYVTASLPVADRTGQVINVSAVGFYYFDETGIWQRLVSSSNSDPTKDAWVDNGVGTRVELGATSLGATRAAGQNVEFADNGRLNLGSTTAPDAGIHLVGSNDDRKDDIRVDSYNASPGANIRMYGARGTSASPTNLASGDTMGQINFHGFFNNQFNGSASGSAMARIGSTYRGDGTTAFSDLNFSVNGIGNPSLYISSGQNIGINTSSPTVSFEVVGRPTTVAALDGVLPPKITGTQLNAKTYGLAQDGTVVYVTAASTSLTGQTSNVNAPGLYYFDGALLKWVNASISSIQTSFSSTTQQSLVNDFTNQTITFTASDSKINQATDFDASTSYFKIKYSGDYQVSSFVGYNPNQPAYTSNQFVASNFKLQKSSDSGATWGDVTGVRFVTTGLACGVGTAIQMPTTIVPLVAGDLLKLVIQRPDITINGTANGTYGGTPTFGQINLPGGQTFTKMLTIVKVR